MFYKVGVSVEEARTILAQQLENTMYLARYTAAHIYALVLDEPSIVWNRSFLESLDLDRLVFDPVSMRADYAPHQHATERYAWPAGWNPEAAFRFNTPRRMRPPQLERAASPPQDTAWTTTLR